MTLDLTTLILEIVNFLVLVWLLQCFVFRPVKRAIEQRQQQLASIHQQAENQQQQAEQLATSYQQKLDQWQQQQTAQQQALQAELAGAREQAMADVAKSVAEEKNRLQMLLEQDKAQLAAQTRAQAVSGAMQLSQHLLSRLAGPGLDEALLDMLIDDLGRLNEAQQAELRQAFEADPNTLKLVAAHPLSDAARQRLLECLGALLQVQLSQDIDVDESLISGLRISIGPRILHANLADELEFFAAGLPHASVG